MSNPHYERIPSTLSILSKLKRPAKPLSLVDRIDRLAFRATLLLACVMLIVAGLGALDMLSIEAVRRVTLAVLAMVLVLFVLWAIVQIVDMVQAARTGYRRAADHVDEDIALDQTVIQLLAMCAPYQLREHAKLMEARAKRLTRRAGIGPVISAIGVIVVNFNDSAEKAELFARLTAIPLFVYSGSLGVLLASAALTIFAGRLEHISVLMSLAADRLERT